MSTSGRAVSSKQAAGHLHANSNFHSGSKPKTQNGVLNPKCELDQKQITADIDTQNQNENSHHQTLVCTVSGY